MTVIKGQLKVVKNRWPDTGILPQRVWHHIALTIRRINKKGRLKVFLLLT